MPKTSQMKSSKYLKQDDCGQGILVTITGCTQENVAMEGQAHEMKWCLHFLEQDKPLVLNTTNIAIIEMVCGSDDTDNWNGRKIVLFADPTISFGGKLVGGIRARAPRNVPNTPVTTAPNNPRPLLVPLATGGVMQVAAPQAAPVTSTPPDDLPF